VTDITEFGTSTIDELKNKLELYKYNPVLMQRVILDTLSEVTDGSINIVDPSNPFVFLLEASTVNTSLFIQENHLNLRRQYPSLSQTEEDIYLHMSDIDYVDRFASPGRCIFIVALLLNDLENAPLDETNNRKLTIPKDTVVTVDNINFTFSYAVDMLRTDNGMIRIQYDVKEQNPLHTLNAGMLDYSVRKNTDGTTWIFFDIELLQVDIKSTQFPIEHGNIFNKTIPYTDQYTYTRVYYKGNDTLNKWKEIKTTHTGLVYDIHDPTVVLQVHKEDLKVMLPSVYTNTDILSGELRIDIYTTKGDLTVDFGTYKISSFSNVLRSFNDEDINTHVSTLSDSSYIIFTDKITTGGKSNLPLEELRKRVIHNSVGVRNLPVSNLQLEAYVSNEGFDVVKNIDHITNRVFLATRKLPDPGDSKIIVSANIGLSSIIIDPVTLSNSDYVTSTNKMYTIKSKTLFKLDNGILKLLSSSDVASIRNLPLVEYVTHINNNRYYYNPFYYVYDETDKEEFTLRSYHLDQPKVNYLNFIDQNNSLQLAVNSDSVTVSKVNDNYVIRVITKSGGFYKQMHDSTVALQLAYYPVGEHTLAYITGNLVGRTDTNERIYEIIIETSLRIDIDDILTINNANMFTSDTLPTPVELTQEYYLIYSTNSITTSFIPGDIDSKVPSFLLGSYFRGVTEEKISLSLGYPMKNLWSKIRPVISNQVYKRYTADIPLLYSSKVYETDPVTGSIFTVDGSNNLIYNVIHDIGDPVLDENNDPVYKHKAGDVILDIDGNPVLENSVSLHSEMDFLLVDAKYLLADNDIYRAYMNNIATTIHTWCSVNIQSIQNLLLEQTRIYYSPSTTFSHIETRVNRERIIRVASELSLNIKLYLQGDVKVTAELRENTRKEIVKYINNYLDNDILNIDDIISHIRTNYSSMVESVQIVGFNEDKQLYNMRILDKNKKFTLKRKLVLESDNNIYVSEDVNIEFQRLPLENIN